MAGLVISAPENGVDHFGLTPTGRRQVRNSLSGATFLDRGIRIFSSDFKRARETAEIAAGILGAKEPVTPTANLRERFFGEFERGPDTIYRGVWERDAQNAPAGAHVESPGAVLERVKACISEIEAAHSHGTILLVAHGDTLQITLAWFNHLPPHRHREIPHLDTAELRRLP